MEEFFWRRLNEKGATESESSLQLTNVFISISHYSWLKHGSLPLCKCTSRAVVWHWDLQLGVTFQNHDIHFVRGIVWAAEQQHLFPCEHWRLLLFALKDLYDWTLYQNKTFNLHFLSMSAFFGVSCGIQSSMMSLFKRQMLIIPAIV